LPIISDKSHEILWCGDFNAYFTSKDKYKASEISISKIVHNISAFMDDHDLCDIWRVLNPESQRYTWQKITQGGVLQS
jgi:exonuclease III